MARIYLIRHAATADTGVRLTGRLPGVGLDAAGRAEAAAVARTLSDIAFAAVYTSPLRRCRETARAIAVPHHLDPIPYRSLIEVDYGSWSGRTFKSLNRLKAARLLSAAPSRVTFPGGESLAGVQARAVAACEDLAATHAGRTIALVSHGDVIRTILAHYLGIPLDLFRRLMIDAASISIVSLAAGAPPEVAAVNRTAG
ncbi:MAG: histidine phosphatase family protein [Acidimicrobiia bacterium]|nr:histidine phosphatase family protein [Acidimicrobiia bacterium]